MKIPFWDNPTLVGICWAAVSVGVLCGGLALLIDAIRKLR